jgi:glycerol-3-phosphate dehydrogenase
LPASGRLDDDDIAQLPRLRQDGLTSVLQYYDCKTDDARLTLAVLLDARARGADILNRRAVTAIAPFGDGYAIVLDERGTKRRIEARFVANASGPWVGQMDGLTSASPPPHPLRLIRGSHIVIRMPAPPQADAYTLQDEEERVIFVIPWLAGRFLIVGTTDVPHQGDPATAKCSAEEQAYLLDAYNRYFANPVGPATEADIVYTWSGVRALHDDTEERPSRVSRSPVLASVANGAGGFVTLYGGKLTTHRALAEQVLSALYGLGVRMSSAWTKNVPLHGGSLSRRELISRAEAGPPSISLTTRRRWAFTYGDQIEALYKRVATERAASEEIAPGVTRAELEYSVEAEDAVTPEDFLLRRTKLHLLLDEAGREAVIRWFAHAS